MGEGPVHAILARKLWTARDQLRERVAAAIGEHVPAFRAAPVSEVAESVALVTAGLVKLLSGEPLSNTDWVQLRDMGRRWSAWGLGAGGQATAVRVAAQVVHRHTLQAADSHPFGRQKERNAAVVQTGEAMVSAVSVVQQAVVGDRPGGIGGRQPVELVDRILCGVPDQWPAVEAEAGAAGLSGPLGLVIVLPPAGAPEGAAKLAARLVERRGGQAGSIQADPLPHVAVVVPVPDEAAWALAVRHVAVDAADAGCGVVAAPSPVAIRRLPMTYGLCRPALPFTSVLPSRSPAFDYAELQMCELLSAVDPVHRAELFEAVVGTLLEKPELLHLLDALVAIGPYNEVGEVLRKPYRSITHGVTLIRKLTGYDWNEPRGRYMLTFAVRLRWLSAVSLASYDEAAWGPIPQFALLGVGR